jgi:hypothetical protein
MLKGERYWTRPKNIEVKKKMGQAVDSGKFDLK